MICILKLIDVLIESHIVFQEKHQTKEKLEGGLRPFGYTIIDHKTGSVYKGSEIMKMNE